MTSQKTEKWGAQTAVRVEIRRKQPLTSHMWEREGGRQTHWGVKQDMPLVVRYTCMAATAKPATFGVMACHGR